MKKGKDALSCPGGLPKKNAVTILDKQPGSTTWALGPDFFIEDTTSTKCSCMHVCMQLASYI